MSTTVGPTMARMLPTFMAAVALTVGVGGAADAFVPGASKDPALAAGHSVQQMTTVAAQPSALSRIPLSVFPSGTLEMA